MGNKCSNKEKPVGIEKVSISKRKKSLKYKDIMGDTL